MQSSTIFALWLSFPWQQRTIKCTFLKSHILDLGSDQAPVSLMKAPREVSSPWGGLSHQQDGPDGDLE